MATKTFEVDIDLKGNNINNVGDPVLALDAANKQWVEAQISGSGTSELPPVITQTNNPPGLPAVGDRYLIGTIPTGVWIGNANSVAEYNGVDWDYTVPVLDNIVYITDVLTTLRYSGTAWVAYSGTALLQNGNAVGAKIAVGTKDNQPASIKTNNIDRFYVSESGQITVSGLTGASSRMAEVNAAGDLLATREIISAYLTAGATTALLENILNWDINGNYTGTAITGTYQGQKHYDANFMFECVSDNFWIRLIRG